MIGHGWVSAELFTEHVVYPRKLSWKQFNSCRCLLAKACQTLKLLAGDGDSVVRSITLHIPSSLALHRLSLSVLSTTSRFSKASLSTTRYIVPVAYYSPITQAAIPVSYYPWKGRFFLRLPV